MGYLDVDRIIDQDYAEQPGSDDYIISDCGPLGGCTQVYCQDTGFHFSDPEWEVVISAIRTDMADQDYFPGVWYQDDHGGLRIVDVTGGPDDE